jgi:hypothetical protein
MASEQPALEQVRNGEPGAELEWEEGAYSARDRLAKLARKKDETEAAVALAQRYLETTPVGLRGSLIDAEGFPKDGLDHYAIRQARHTIDCGKHDLRRINDRMLDLLVTAQQEGGTSGSTSPMAAGAKRHRHPRRNPVPQTPLTTAGPTLALPLDASSQRALLHGDPYSAWLLCPLGRRRPKPGFRWVTS